MQEQKKDFKQENYKRSYFPNRNLIVPQFPIFEITTSLKVYYRDDNNCLRRAISKYNKRSGVLTIDYDNKSIDILGWNPDKKDFVYRLDGIVYNKILLPSQEIVKEAIKK